MKKELSRHSHLFRRLALFALSFAAIYVINFLIPRLMPGDPFRYTSSVSGEDMDTAYSQEQLDQMRAYYGLDQPLHIQFAETALRNLRGDLGQSIYYKKPVITVLRERLPWSLTMMLTALVLSLCGGTLLALCGVWRPRLDRAAYGVLSVLAEIPAFLIGTLLLFLVAAQVGWIPLSGGATPFAVYSSLGERLWDLVSHSLLPILAMVAVTLPAFYFTARASFLALLEKPFLLGARSRGLGPWVMRTRYILRNSSGALVARFFLSMGTAVGGTILIENVFAYPGLGKVLREAVLYRDYMMIQGVFLLSAILVLVSLFVADCINAHSSGNASGGVQ